MYRNLGVSASGSIALDGLCSLIGLARAAVNPRVHESESESRAIGCGHADAPAIGRNS